jgi:hypothetical protein
VSLVSLVAWPIDDGLEKVHYTGCPNLPGLQILCELLAPQHFIASNANDEPAGGLQLRWDTQEKCSGGQQEFVSWVKMVEGTAEADDAVADSLLVVVCWGLELELCLSNIQVYHLLVKRNLLVGSEGEKRLQQPTAVIFRWMED